MADRVKDKTAIITGAAKGIGKGVAQIFATEGAKVVIADFDKQAGEEAVAEIKQAGGEAIFIEVDITKQVETEKMAEETIKQYGAIDILVSNAGIYPKVPIEAMTEADWDKIFDINLKGAFFAVKAVLPEMTEKKYGRIVLTSSITGPRVAAPGFSHYAATKGGLNGFIRGLALELAKYNITVSGVEPGIIVTPGLATLWNSEYIKTTAAAIPLRRLGTPEDVGYAELFLASDEASYITGQTIIVDGGQILPELRTAEE